MCRYARCRCSGKRQKQKAAKLSKILSSVCSAGAPFVLYFSQRRRLCAPLLGAHAAIEASANRTSETIINGRCSTPADHAPSMPDADGALRAAAIALLQARKTQNIA